MYIIDIEYRNDSYSYQVYNGKDAALFFAKKTFNTNMLFHGKLFVLQTDISDNKPDGYYYGYYI